MFDPYHKWLGIQPDQQPPTWYQLLGISPRERDPDVIEEAAIRQTAHVRTYQNGPHAQECARILSEIARARATLLDPAKRQQYDLRLAQSAAPREVGPAPVTPAGNEFQFLGSPAEAASPSGELSDVLMESPISSLARKRARTSTVGKKLGFMVAIVLGAAIPVGGLVFYYTWAGSKSHPTSTHPARGDELAQVKPEPGSTVLRVFPTTPAVPRPGSKPRPKPTPRVPNQDPPADEGKRDNPVENVPVTPLPSEPAPAPVKKMPVPEMAEQVKAEKVIRDLFRQDYLAAKRPAAKHALAAKLIQKAEETTDDPAARFVLLREARDLAAQAGDVSVAITAAEETIRRYDVEPLPLKLATLTAVSKLVITPPANRELVEAALRVLDEAVVEDQFDTASKLLALAEPASRGAMSTALVAKVQACGKDLAERKQEAEAVRELAETLRQKPDDPRANLLTGKYLCFRQGKWEQGLPMLARGGDAALAELAKKDLAGPSETTARAEVGDGWWSLAETQRGGSAEIVLKGRANFWYRKALPGLTGLNQDRIEKRIKEYAAKNPAHKSAAVAGELRRFTGHKARVTSVALSADGSRAVSGDADGTVLLWDTETGRELQRFNDHQGEVGGVAISSDGNRICSGGKDGKGMYYIMEGGQFTYSSIGAPIECMTLSPDGKYPLMGRVNGVVTVWAPQPGGRTARWARARGAVIYSVAFSPDGRLVLFAAADGLVRLWDPMTNKDIGRLAARLPEIHSVAFSPDGRQVLTAGADRVIRLWDARKGKEVRVFKGHAGRINSVAFTKDGNYLLSGSDDKTVRLWDVKTGREWHRYPWHTDKVTSVAIAAAGRLAISGSDDKTVRVWSLPK